MVLSIPCLHVAFTNILTYSSYVFECASMICDCRVVREYPHADALGRYTHATYGPE